MEKTLRQEAEKDPMRAVIFDLDGLLIDSEPIWNKAYPVFLSKKNIVDNPEVSSSFKGRGIREIITKMKESMGLVGETDLLMQEYRDNFYELSFKGDSLKLMEGALSLLGRLQGKYLLALATSGHTRQMADEILRKLGVYKYFQQIMSGDDVAHGKPDPDVYLVSAQKLETLPGSCLVLEDSVNGVLAGKSAGMRVLGVNEEDKLRSLLKEAGADEVYTSLSEVVL